MNKNQAPAKRPFQPDFVTPKFTLSFPHLFVKRQPSPKYPKSEPKYELTMLFDKSIDLSVINQHIEKAVKDTWPNGMPAHVTKFPIKDGDTQSERGEYKGHWYAVARTTKRIKIYNETNTGTIEKEDEIYGGMIARAVLHCVPFDDGVSLWLVGLQKLEDGKPFGGGGDVGHMFGPATNQVAFGNAPMNHGFAQQSYQAPQAPVYQPPANVNQWQPQPGFNAQPYQAPQAQPFPNQQLFS